MSGCESGLNNFDHVSTGVRGSEIAFSVTEACPVRPEYLAMILSFTILLFTPWFSLDSHDKWLT